MKYRVNGFFYFPFVADCFYYPCIHFLSYTPSPLSLDNVSRAGARDVNYRRIKICIRAAAGVPLREKEGDGNRRESTGRNGNTAQVYNGNLCGFRGAHFGKIWRFCSSSLIPMDVYIVKGDGGLFETGLMKLFDLFKFVIKVDRVWTHTVPLCVWVCSGVLNVACLNNWISEQGLLIFDRLAELLAQIAGLSMRFSSIYRLDDKV